MLAVVDGICQTPKNSGKNERQSCGARSGERLVVPVFTQNLTETQATLLIGLLTMLAGMVGYFANRVLTRAGAQERASHLSILADLKAKMAASGLSVQDIQEFESQLKRGDNATASAVISAVSPNEETPTPETQLPLHYWTTVAMNARASARLRSLDAQLDEVLTDLGTLLSDRETEALERAQRAWKAFRQRDMTFVAAEYYGGSIAPLVAISHGTAMTEDRINVMRADLAGRKERRS